MGEDAPGGKFGCGQCWPPDAGLAHSASRSLEVETELLDESHVRVTIKACRICSQRFVSVFTEMIDWEGGDDPQYWTLLPVTVDEATDLVRKRDAFDERMLDALGRERRSLRHDFPKGKPARTCWGTGIPVGPHD